MASSELILMPEIDESTLRDAERRTEEAFQRASKQIGSDLKKDISEGIKNGADSGSNILMTRMKLAAGAIAVAAGAVVTDTFQKTLTGVDEVSERFNEKVKTISDLFSSSSAFGISPERYAGLITAGVSVGLEQDDIRDMIAGFVAAFQDEEAIKYKELAETKGIESSFVTMLKTAAEMPAEQAQQFLTKILGETDAVLAQRLVEPIRGLLEDGIETTFQSVIDAIYGGQIDLAKLADSLERSQEQANKIAFQDAKDFYDSLLAGVSPEATQAELKLRASQRALEAEHMKTFDLKVDTRVIANELEIKQIKAGSMAVNETIELKNRVYEGIRDYIDVMSEKMQSIIAQTDKPMNGQNLKRFAGSVWDFSTTAPISLPETIKSWTDDVELKRLMEAGQKPVTLENLKNFGEAFFDWAMPDDQKIVQDMLENEKSKKTANLNRSFAFGNKNADIQNAEILTGAKK